MVARQVDKFCQKMDCKGKKVTFSTKLYVYFMKEHDKVDIGKWLSITEKDCC